MNNATDISAITQMSVAPAKAAAERARKEKRVDITKVFPNMTIDSSGVGTQKPQQSDVTGPDNL